MLIISGSFDPNVAGSQPAAQNGERRDFVKPAINAAIFHNETLPGFWQERQWRLFGHRPARFFIQPFQQLERGKQRILVRGSPKREALEELRRETTNGHVPLTCLDERIFVGLPPEFGGYRLGGKQAVPADRTVERLEGIALGVPGFGQHVDRRREHAHQIGDLFRRRLIAALDAFTRLGEEAENQPDKHADSGVRQTCFELEQLGHESGAPATRPIFVEKEGRRGGSFARQLAKPPLGHPLGNLGIEPNGAHVRQSVEDRHEV